MPQNLHRANSTHIGLALYRALLRQCSASPSHAPWHAETTSLVKQRFRKYQRLQSPSQVVNALNAGYRVSIQATTSNSMDANMDCLQLDTGFTRFRLQRKPKRFASTQYNSRASQGSQGRTSRPAKAKSRSEPSETTIPETSQEGRIHSISERDQHTTSRSKINICSSTAGERKTESPCAGQRTRYTLPAYQEAPTEESQWFSAS